MNKDTSKLIRINTISEEDGKLSVLEGGKDIPFEIKRTFLIYAVPSENIVRANHASINTEFFMQVITGSVEIELFDGKTKEEIELNQRDKGIYVPIMTWMITKKFSPDAILLVYSSKTYEDCRYIESYSEFLKKID